MRGAALLGAAVVVAACGDPRRDDDLGASSAAVDGTDGDDDDADDDDDDDDDDTGGSADGDTGGLKLDVGAATGGMADDGGAPDECDSVDVLFVIDNSASMADQQSSLIASFDGFVTGMQQQLDGADSYHIGVVTTDNYNFNAPNCRDIGDLVTQTGGFDSSNGICHPFNSGGRYLDDTEPDLPGRFACMAQVGTQGADDERPMRAMLDALDPSNNAAGACNEGFSRPDSLLVIVVISDEDDVPEPYGCDPDDFFDNACDTVGSGGDPDAWVAELAGYKPNIDTNVVVLSLVGLAGNNDCGAVPASKLIGFANRFGDNGYTDDVCASSYDEFFAAALPVVDTACENWIPPEG